MLLLLSPVSSSSTKDELQEFPPRSPSRLEMREEEPARSSSRQMPPLLLPRSALEGLSVLQLAESASGRDGAPKSSSK